MMTKDKLRQLSGDERLGQMRESEYLGAEDIDDGTEPILTIAGLWYGSVTLQRGKENKDVLSFKEERVPGVLQVRPLIVNSTNRKTLRKLFGDAKASTLVGKQIQLFVDHNVRDPQDGGMTDGIRIRPYKPRPPKQEPVPPQKEGRKKDRQQQHGQCPQPPPAGSRPIVMQFCRRSGHVALRFLLRFRLSENRIMVPVIIAPMQGGGNNICSSMTKIYSALQNYMPQRRTTHFIAGRNSFFP